MFISSAVLVTLRFKRIASIRVISQPYALQSGASIRWPTACRLHAPLVIQEAHYQSAVCWQISSDVHAVVRQCSYINPRISRTSFCRLSPVSSWLLRMDANIRRYSRLNSRRLDIIISRRGNSPVSSGCDVAIND